MSKNVEIIPAEKTMRDITSGTDKLLGSLQTRFPEVSIEDLQVISIAVLLEIGKHIEDGEDIAFIKKNKDGTAKLTVLSLSLKLLDKSASVISELAKPASLNSGK